MFIIKIAIIGYSGSGKSTLAQTLGNYFKIPVLHLDTVQFTANWQPRDPVEALAQVRKFMQQESWVIDGNYTNFDQAERLAQADQIIFLNFSRWTCLRRIFQRLKKYQGKTRPDMAANCVEKVDFAFLWWVLYEGRTADRRAHYQNILRAYPEKSVVVRNQTELNTLVADLTST